MLRGTKTKIEVMIINICRDFIQGHNDQAHSNQYYKTCEICGCLVDSTKAIIGESIVKSIPTIGYFHTGFSREIKDKIYTPYYCLIHAPKNCKSERPVKELYNELIMEVSNKFPEESRHETALRYIREREKGSSECCAKDTHHHETGRNKKK